MLFRYTVRFYVDQEDRELYAGRLDDKGVCKESGIIAAESYGAAADELVDYYGENNFIEFTALYEMMNPIDDTELKDMLNEEA